MAAPQAESEAFWRAIHEAFDPILPVTDPALRAERDPRYNPMVELDKRLRLPILPMCYGVAGGVGSGKSTELLAAAGKLTDDALVVFLDLWQHFETSVRDPGALDHLQPWELLGLLGLAVVRAGSERFGHQWGQERDELARAMQAFGAQQPNGPKFDVARLAGGLSVLAGGAVGGMAKVGLDLLKAATDSTTWNWPIGLRDRRRTTDQEPQVRRVLDATNGVIEALRTTYGRKLILVVDGLDRVRLPDTFEDLFVESSLLRELSCDVVVSTELSLVHRYRSRLRITKTFELTNIPVTRSDDPSALGAGIGFFRELTRRRVDTLDIPAPAGALAPELLDRLAWCSGGRLRDFMSLVREIAIQGLIHRVGVTSPEISDRVIDDLRREKEAGLNTNEIAELQKVLDDPRHRLPGGEVALGLLDKHLLLAYPNESTWYLPHPALTLKLLRTPKRPG
jgi:hypothetical protein